jgi:hypothetical protein
MRVFREKESLDASGFLFIFSQNKLSELYMKKIICALVVLFIASINTSAGNKTDQLRFGFTSIETQGDVEKSVADTLTEMVKIELLTHNNIKVIPLGSDRKLVLSEIELQQAGFSSGGTAADMSGFLGANKILQGKISKLANAYYVSIHVLDLKTGSYDLAKKVTICNLGEMQDRVTLLVNAVVRGMDGENINPDAGSAGCKSDIQTRAEISFKKIETTGSIRNLEIKRISASSVLREPGFDHNPWVMTDDVIETAWAHSKNGQNAVGEWLLFNFSARADVSEVAIINGLGLVEGKWGNLYEANSAIQSADFIYSNGLRESVSFKKTHEVQKVTLTKASGVDWIRLVITSEYPGKKFKDTCISEIKFFGK